MISLANLCPVFSSFGWDIMIRLLFTFKGLYHDSGDSSGFFLHMNRLSGYFLCLLHLVCQKTVCGYGSVTYGRIWVNVSDPDPDLAPVAI